MKTNTDELFNILAEHFENIGCELNFQTPYQLLVAVILSAQCTDKQVNKVTDILFKLAPTAEKMLQLGEEKISQIIHPCGFYKVKAKNIVNCSRKIVNNFNNTVPNTMQDLLTLDGVGRKTASVILAECFNVPALAVDTHVFRVSNRLGISKSKNVEECEQQLKKLLPASQWKDWHYLLVLFGRYYCKAKKYDCENCKAKNHCLNYKNKGN